MRLTNLEEIAKKIINAGAVSIRDIDNSEEPFVYSTGNRGPGYVMIKGLVGQPNVLMFLTKNLAHKIIEEKVKFDFIEGNATGGMIPAWQLSRDLSEILKKEIPCPYLRESRKEGGHGELITGDKNNPLIEKGMWALIVEELVNYAGTVGNAAEIFRSEGYSVSHAACILSYDHPQSNARLKEKGLNLVSLINLSTIINVAEANKLFSQKAIDSYKDFLKDPINWQLSRNLVVPTDTAKKAVEKGYSMTKLSTEEAINRGAPAGKVKEGVVYWAQENGKK